MNNVSAGNADWIDETGGQVIARFYRSHKPDGLATKESGELVIKDVDMVEIRQVGSKDNQLEEVHDGHKNRWPQQWAAYERGQEQIQSGTPIDLLFPGQPSVVLDLKRVNVMTIEALLGAPESAGAQIPFLIEWKKRAKKFLDAKSRAADTQGELAMMKEQIAVLTAALAQANQPKKRGRPAKTTENAHVAG